jgi:inhibitor of KinA
MTVPCYVPLGDSAVTIVLGEGVSLGLSSKVLRLAESLRSASTAGAPAIVEVVPAYASLTVFYDPLRVTYSSLLAQLRSFVEQSRLRDLDGGSESVREVRIPVRYDGDDLIEVAERTGHTTAEVIALHSGRAYHVYMLGFVPGFAYLGDLDSSLVLPRRSAPRTRVPTGAVAVAERQTAVYPFSTPGGWHLIGRTTVKMFDVSASEPALLRVGDRVVFDPVSR